MKKLLRIFSLFLIVLITLAACANNNKETNEENDAGSNIAEDHEDHSEEQEEDSEELLDDEVTEEDPVEDDIYVYQYKVYRTDDNFEELFSETLEHEIDFTPYPEDKNTLEETVSFLFDELTYADAENSFPTVSEEIILRGVSVDGNHLTLDFDETLYPYIQGSASEIMFVESLANTLVNNLDGVDLIFFSENGTPLEVLNHMYVLDGVTSNLD